MEDITGKILIYSSICKEELIEYLRNVEWKEFADGRHYAKFAGFLNGYTNMSGKNGAIYELKPKGEKSYGKGIPIMMALNTQYVERETTRQRKEFLEQNPELEHTKKFYPKTVTVKKHK